MKGGRSVDPGAVGGGADAVRQADAALARDALGVAGLEAADPAGAGLEAVARGLPVGGGLGGGAEALDAAAAGCRGGGAGAASIGEAGGDGRVHLPAADGRVGVRSSHDQQSSHQGDRHDLSTSSHVSSLELDCTTSERWIRFREQVLCQQVDGPGKYCWVRRMQRLLVLK
jgi:hypothetical protein